MRCEKTFFIFDTHSKFSSSSRHPKISNFWLKKKCASGQKGKKGSSTARSEYRSMDVCELIILLSLLFCVVVVVVVVVVVCIINNYYWSS